MVDEETRVRSENDLLAELTAAKQAYRDDPTDENRERKATAVDAVRAHRMQARAGRTRPAITGDARRTGQEG